MGQDTFTLGFRALTKFDGESKPVAYRIHICTKPHPQILEEELKHGDRVIYETLPKNPGSASRDLAVKYDNFARGGKKPQTTASSERSVLSQYREIAQKNRNLLQCVRLVQSIIALLPSLICIRSKSKINARLRTNREQYSY